MKNDNVNYSFAYYTKGREDIAGEFAIDDNMIRNLSYDSTITWDCILRDFIDFLSGIYGYDIGEQVKFKRFAEKLEEVEGLFDWYNEEADNAEGEAPKV